MNVYLIFPDVNSFHGMPYHPGLASIAAVLMKKGHRVKMRYFNDATKEDDLLKEVREFEPGLVGFTAVETQFGYVKALAPKIKSVHGCLVVCGGPYATLAPESVLGESGSIDAVIVGEGESAVDELVEKLGAREDWRRTGNLVYLDGAGALVRNRLNPLLENLDALPFPRTDIFPYQEIIDRHNVAVFHFNRGCPYLCAYCSNKALGAVYGRSSNPLRYRTVKSAIDEIVATLAKYRLRDDTLIQFGDDLFIADKRWLGEFCSAYLEKVKRPFWCTGRSNLIDDEVCALLKSAGCRMLMMSVESGNDYIRNEVMRRNISRETMTRSFEICAAHSIDTLATCIIGLPFETPEMIEESIRVVAALKGVVAYGINIFYPYRGTQLRKVCEENGLLPQGSLGQFVERKESVLKMPQLTKEAIRYYYANWTKLVTARQGMKARAKYAMRVRWTRMRETRLGQKLRSVFNDTATGRRFKKGVMRVVWNKSN